MIIRRFLAFLRTASAAERAVGANALARAYLVSPLLPEERDEAVATMTVLLEDPSPEVRLALAEGLGHAEGAPPHIVLALADDAPEIAATVLRASPVLVDAELVDRVATGSAPVQRAIAERRPVSPAVAAALAEIGEAEACEALLANEDARLPLFSLERIVERHGADPAIRERLLERDDVPGHLRRRLALALADQLQALVLERSWLAPRRADLALGEALEAVTLAVADGEDRETAALVDDLVGGRSLTPLLLFKALCAGHLAFVEAALARLAELPATRVRGAMRPGAAKGFHAIYRRAGLPEESYAAFQAALDDILATGAAIDEEGFARLLERRGVAPARGEDPLLAELRRLSGRAARDAALALARSREVDQTLIRAEAA
jgi:uncharacterized protein (DUF2336 family)